MSTHKAYRIARIAVFVMIFAVIPFFGQWAMYPHKKQLEEDYWQRMEAAKEAEEDNDREQSGVPTKDNGVRSEISDRSTKENNVPRTAGGSDASQVKSTVHTVSASPVKEEAACTVDQNVASEPAPATDAVPAHVHNWQPITQTVHHDATGHMETVVISPAYDEVSYTQTSTGILCRDCGRMFSNVSDWEAFVYAAIDAGDLSHGSYEVCFEQVPTSIHHDAVCAEVWVDDSPAYDEEVVVGYVCECGERK